METSQKLPIPLKFIRRVYAAESDSRKVRFPAKAKFRVAGRKQKSAGWSPALPAPMDYFLGGTMVSFIAFETRNFTVILAAILRDSPVAGLRPMRAAR